MDYFKQAEEKLYSVPVLRKRLMIYEDARDKLIRRTGPSGISPIDLTNPAVMSSKPEEDFSGAERIAHYQRKINEMRDDIEQVTSVVELLRPEDRSMIELRYFRIQSGHHLTKSQIARIMYISEISVYRRIKRAVNAFVELYPW